MIIAPGSTNGLTLSQIHSEMNKTPVQDKHMDKSLRLIHRSDKKVNFDELKVHTTISRLIGKGRNDKRQDALQLVKASVTRELGGNQPLADHILNKVGLSGKDRITMRDLNKLKGEVDFHKGMENLMKSLYEPNGGGLSAQEKTEAVAQVGQYMKDHGINSQYDLKKHIDLSQLPSVAKLLGKVTDENSVRTILGQLANVKDDFVLRNTWQKPANMELKDFNLIKNSFSICLTENRTKVTELGNEVLKNNFETTGKDQVPGKLKEFEDLRANPKNVPPLTTKETMELREGGIGALTQNGQWTAASSGAGGAMIVRDPQSPTGGSVIKLEEKDKTVAAVQVTKFFDAISDSPKLKSPMPFDFAGAYEVDLNQNGDLQKFKDKLGELHNQTVGRAQNNVQKHLTNVDSQDFSVSKLPLVNGTEVNKLGAPERLALLQSSEFPQDLGKLMVIGRLLGLNDHVTLTPVGDENQVSTGQNNVSNLMISKDTGRLVVIDPSINSEKIAQGGDNQKEQYAPGYPDEATRKVIGSAKEFMLGHLDTPEKIEQAMLDGLNQTNPTPMNRILEDLFVTRDTDTMSAEHEQYLMDQLSESDKKKFTAQLYLGVIEGLKYVEANKEAFIEGGQKMNGQFMSDPKTLLDNITTDLGKLDEVAKELQKYITG